MIQSLYGSERTAHEICEGCYGLELFSFRVSIFSVNWHPKAGRYYHTIVNSVQSRS